MSRTREISRWWPGSTPRDSGAIQVGLPIESDRGRLYPVYAFDTEQGLRTDARVRYPVGIVEVQDETIRYTSLDRRQLWALPLVASLLAVIATILILTLWRAKRGRTVWRS